MLHLFCYYSVHTDCLCFVSEKEHVCHFAADIHAHVVCEVKCFCARALRIFRRIFRPRPLAFDGKKQRVDLFTKIHLEDLR